MHYWLSSRWLSRSHALGSAASLPGRRCGGRFLLGALLACGLVPRLAAQRTGNIMAQATVVSAEGTRTFQLVRQRLQSTRPSTIAARGPGDPEPLASVVIDTVARLPGNRPHLVVVTIQYLRN